MVSKNWVFHSLFGSIDGYTVGIMAIKSLPLGIAKSVQDDPKITNRSLKSLFLTVFSNAAKVFSLEYCIRVVYSQFNKQSHIAHLEEVESCSKVDIACSTLKIFMKRSIPYHVSVLIVRCGYKLLSFLTFISSITDKEEKEFYLDNEKAVIAKHLSDMKKTITKYVIVGIATMTLESIGAAISTLLNPSLYKVCCTFRPSHQVYFAF